MIQKQLDELEAEMTAHIDGMSDEELEAKLRRAGMKFDEPPRWRCQVCGNESAVVAHNASYANPNRCIDAVCDGPAVRIDSPRIGKTSCQ